MGVTKLKVKNERILKNEKVYFELLIRKMKEQNLGFEDPGDFCTEMKHYTLVLLIKNPVIHRPFGNEAWFVEYSIQPQKKKKKFSSNERNRQLIR